MASSFFSNLTMLILRLRSPNQSVALRSSVEPAATQTAAPSRSLASLMLADLRVMKVWPSK